MISNIQKGTFNHVLTKKIQNMLAKPNILARAFILHRSYRPNMRNGMGKVIFGYENNHTVIHKGLKCIHKIFGQNLVMSPSSSAIGSILFKFKAFYSIVEFSFLYN